MEYKLALRVLAYKSMSKVDLEKENDDVLEVTEVLREAGILIDLTSEPQHTHKAYAFKCSDFDDSMSTAIEVLHRRGYKVATRNVGDYFTIKVSKNKCSTFAFEYNFDNDYGKDTQTVLISTKTIGDQDA